MLIEHPGVAALAAVCSLFVIIVCYCYIYAPTLTSVDVPSIDGKDGPYGKGFCEAVEEGTAQVF